MESVLTVTLNPAVDISTSVDRLKARQKLRCETPRYDPGGGGINVSRVLKELGGDSRAYVALGGAAGEQMRALMEEAGIDIEVREVPGETRFSLKVMDREGNRQYRFVLPGPELVREVANDLFSELTACMRKGRYTYVVASGSLTPGLPDDFYADLAIEARRIGSRFILDTSGNALKAALASRPYLIKPNRSEAGSLLDEAKGDPDTPEDLAAQLFSQGMAEVVVVTLGADGAVMVSQEGMLRMRPPAVEMLSTVGAGDSFIGAITYGLANDWSLADAGRYGVAAAASAVTTEATGLCSRSQTQQFFEEIADKVEPLR